MRDWEKKTLEETAIEKAGYERLVKPYIDKTYTWFKKIPMSTPLQTMGKIDGMAKIGDEQFVLEWKCVSNDYQNIFGEYKAEHSDGSTTEGWMNRKSKWPNVGAHLIYAMSTKMYVYDYHALRAWYAESEKTWRVSKIWDAKFQQYMYGHLIPLKEIEKFCIFNSEVNT
jgi:hypothetical protein